MFLLRANMAKSPPRLTEGVLLWFSKRDFHSYFETCSSDSVHHILFGNTLQDYYGVLFYYSFLNFAPLKFPSFLLNTHSRTLTKNARYPSSQRLRDEHRKHEDMEEEEEEEKKESLDP